MLQHRTSLRLLTALAGLAPAFATAAIAAGPEVAGQRTFSGRAQVTGIDLIVDVRDASGAVPAGLVPADFEVLEDGDLKPVIGVETLSGGTASASPVVGAAPAAGRRAEVPAGAPATPWHLVVYVDEFLSSPRTVRRACEGLAAQAGRLTELGPVEIVVARPQAEKVLPPTRSARLVEQTLQRLAREAVGRDELRRLRKRFLSALQGKGEFDGTGIPTLVRDPFSEPTGGTGRGEGPGGGLGPGTGGPRSRGVDLGGDPEGDPPPITRDGSRLSRTALVRSFVAEEKGLLARQLDVMLAFVAGYLDPPPRALLLVSDGYDTDPREFYMAGLTPGSTLDSELTAFLRPEGAEPISEQLAQGLAAAGWVSINLAFGALDTGTLVDAELSGRGRVGGLIYSKDNSVFNLPTATVYHPLAPLNKMAAYTGGDTLTGLAKLPASLTRLGERVRLTYQVDRLPDGKLHQIEVRCLRPGVEVKAPRWSGVPALEAVASARARRLLAGDVERGELPLVAAVALEEGRENSERRPGTLQARVDLTAIAASLADAPPTSVRVTVAVSFPQGEPYVHSELVGNQRLAGRDGWTYTSPVTLPELVDRVAVLIEEGATGAWGGGLAAVITGPLPAAVAAPTVRATSAGETPEAAAVASDPASAFLVPAELLPGRKPIVLLAPAGEVQVGNVRLESLVSDPRIARVDFLLDGERAASRDRPPFEARVGFGAIPSPRMVEAVGYETGGREVARDFLMVNEGQGSFRVRIIDPRSGDRVGAVDVEAEVKMPPHPPLDRLEVFWNGDQVATLFEPPFRTRVLIPPEAPTGYLSVQARRKDGSTAEDVVFMNGTGASERVDVRLVELPTVVTDSHSRPVLDLGKGDFRVFEEGERQTISDFRDAAEAPLAVGVLIDTSGSMYPVLDQVKRAAIDFVALALRAQDRAFVVDFAAKPRLAQPLTGDVDALVRAVAGLRAAGGTALCDAVVYALVEMQQVRGRRALVMLTDGVGRDERVSFETCLRMVEHTGVPIYAILLAGDDPTAKLGGVSSETLTRLVGPVGGRLFVAERVGSVGGIYRAILDELRSQYLLAYYPGVRPRDEGWRRVAVEVDRPDLEARTIAGYFP